MGSRITITSKVFSTAFVWKNKAYKINEIQKKIAFNPSEYFGFEQQLDNK
jgi:hypothetical protein